MAIEIVRRITDRFSSVSAREHGPDAIIMNPSFIDPMVVELSIQASKLIMAGKLDEARSIYAQMAAREKQIFETLPTNMQRGVRDKAEYGVMAVSGYIKAHQNEEAREFGANLLEDPLIPQFAKDRVSYLLEFLDKHPIGRREII